MSTRNHTGRAAVVAVIGSLFLAAALVAIGAADGSSRDGPSGATVGQAAPSDRAAPIRVAGDLKARQ